MYVYTEMLLNKYNIINNDVSIFILDLESLLLFLRTESEFSLFVSRKESKDSIGSFLQLKILKKGPNHWKRDFSDKKGTTFQSFLTKSP